MGKRANGEGTIFQRGDGWWVAKITIDGKRREFAGKSQATVKQRLGAAKLAAAQGLPVVNEQQAVGAYLQRWLEESARPKVRPRTYASYEQIVRVHLLPGLGHYKLAKLTALDVQRYLNEKAASGASPRLVQYIHAILRAALNRAVKWQVVARNVATLVDPPRGAGVPIRPLTPDAATRLMAAAENHVYEHLYATLLATGLRLGEALALRWGDVDLEAGTLTVHHTLERLPRQPWRLAEPKSASSRRTIPLIGPARTALKAQRVRQAEMRLRMGEAWQDHGFVFASAVGTPLSGTNVLHQYKALLADAGLPTSHRLHDLRHSTATYLLAAGVPARVVMELLGHSQISLTLNTYSHVLPAMLGDAAERLEAIFPGAVAAV